MSETKVCTRCKQERPDKDFRTHARARQSSVCNTCRDANRRILESDSYRSHLNRLCTTARHRGKNAPGGFSIDTDHLCELWEGQKGRCALSGVIMTHHADGTGRKDFNVSLDRIVVDGPYNPGNVQLVCDRVNMMRGTLPMDMFYWWVKNINEYSCD